MSQLTISVYVESARRPVGTDQVGRKLVRAGLTSLHNVQCSIRQVIEQREQRLSMPVLRRVLMN